MRRTLILVFTCAVVGILASAATVWAAPTTTTTSSTTTPTSATSTTTVPSVIHGSLVVEPSTVQPGGTITLSGDCNANFVFLRISTASGVAFFNAGWSSGHFSLTVQISTTATHGTYTVSGDCVDDPALQQAVPIVLGPVSFTIAGTPISSAATAVTATPTLTG